MSPQPRTRWAARGAALGLVLGLVLGLLLSQTLAPAHEMGHDDLAQGARCVYCTVVKPVMALPAASCELARSVLSTRWSVVHAPVGFLADVRVPHVPRAPPAPTASADVA